jgi:hypothetical protein
VSETGTDAVALGDLVAMAYGHKTAHTVDPLNDRFVPLPPELDPMLGVYVAHMGPICANGLLHAAAEVAGPGALRLGDGVRGRQVLVTGAGVIGLLVALFARHHGAAEVLVADATPQRLEAARALGLEAVDDAEATARRVVKERWRRDPTDCGADVVFQCRGRTAALAAALRSLRPQGTVIDLAFYQGGAPDLALGERAHPPLGPPPAGRRDRRAAPRRRPGDPRAPGHRPGPPGRRARPAGRRRRPPPPRHPGRVRLPGRRPRLASPSAGRDGGRGQPRREPARASTSSYSRR